MAQLRGRGQCTQIDITVSTKMDGSNLTSLCTESTVLVHSWKAPCVVGS